MPGRFPNFAPAFLTLQSFQMDTIVTLEILKKLRDHADGKDVKLPPPGMVQKAIETCIEWGEGLEGKPNHKVQMKVANSAFQLEQLIITFLNALKAENGNVISIQYQVADREQEHHPPYSAMIHYTL